MAKQTVNIGSTANDGTGDQLRNAFDKLNDNFDEVYGNNFVIESMLNDNIVGADELKVTGNGTAGQILTSNADGTFSWVTGVTGDITGVEAGAGLTGGGTSGDVTLNVIAGTGITVAADEVALDTTVQDEITLNTAKTGITSAQASEIVANNAKVTNATHTGDVTGAGALTIANDAVVTDKILDVNVTRAKIADDAINAAKLDVTGNGTAGQILSSDGDGTMTWITGVEGDITSIVAGTGLDGTSLSGPIPTINITAGGVGTTQIADDAVTEDKLANAINTEIGANTAKTGITAQQASDIATNNAKVSDQTVVLTEGTNVTITGTYPSFTISSDDVVGAVTSVNGDAGVVVLDTADIAENTNLYYTEARVTANAEVTANTNKTGITTQQTSDITANNAKVTNATHTGDVTGATTLTIATGAVTTDKILDANVTVGKMAANSVDSDQYVDGSIDTAHLSDDSITYDKIAGRYTALSTIASPSASQNLDTASFSVFNITGNLNSTQTLNLTGMKTGQVIAILATGSSTLTLTSDDSSETFNNLGAVTYDGGENNHIQILCVSDLDSAAIYNYTISTYTADNTPN